MKLYAFCILALFLGGCSAKMGTIPEDALGDLAGSGVVFASDEVQEAAIRASAHKKHTEAYGTAYAASGLEVEFEVVEINGTTAYMPTKLSFKEKPQLGRAPSLDKAPHPAWGVAERVTLGAMKYGALGYGIHEAAGVVEALAGRRGSDGTSIDASNGGSVEYTANESSVESGGNGAGSVTDSEANKTIGVMNELPEESEEPSGSEEVEGELL